MRSDRSLCAEHPPRGLILSTGEDVPPGQSLRGRMLVLELSPGDVPLAGLSAHQCAATAGLYAQALAGFVRWLAPQYEDLRGRLPAERTALRDRAMTGSGSARTPGIVADLALGLNLFLDFALAAGALSVAEREALAGRGWNALAQAAAAQAEHVQAAEPTALFLRLLAGALASGRAHVAGPDGMEPADPKAWGWWVRTVGAGEHLRSGWQSQGQRIGWVDGAELYLEPEASYAAAQGLASNQGGGLSVAPRTLHKRLHEQGLLLAVETHGDKTRYVVRRTLEGRRRTVLCLRADALTPPESAPSAPIPPNPQQEEDLQGRTPAGGVRHEASECANGALGPVGCATPTATGNGHCDRLAHLAHSDTGEETHAGTSEADDGRGDAWEGGD